MIAIDQRLVSPWGPVSHVQREPPLWGLPEVRIATAWTGSGYPGRPWPKNRHGARGQSLLGDDHAQVVAVAEACERYAGYYLPETVVDARQQDLDGAMDLRSAPACSEAELSNPRCPILPADPAAHIRWLPATELLGSTPGWVPAAWVCKGLNDIRPEERFVLPVSTGHAVHTSRAEAVNGALTEVVERDAVACSWLLRLPLPQLQIEIPPAACPIMTWNQKNWITTNLYDATLDVGIPTVLALQQAPYDRWYQYLTGAATAAKQNDAASKVLLEMVAFRDHPDRADLIPTSPDACTTSLDLARYMGQEDKRTAYAHLLDNPHAPASPHDLVAGSVPAAAELTACLLQRLADVVNQVFLVELTPPSLAEAGLHHVVAVIPELQPVSLHPDVHYKAHPRLRQVARAWDRTLEGDTDLNPWPQPFP